MEERLIEKLKNNPICELSIEEIKMLYGIDYNPDNYLYKYISKRDNYSDMLKIFDKNMIATSDDEINEDTNVFIGNLTISPDKNIPSYNLKYIIGYLVIASNQYTTVRLENLEKVTKDILVVGEDCFFDIGLDNLRNVIIVDASSCRYIKVDKEYNINDICDIDIHNLYNLLYNRYMSFPFKYASKMLRNTKSVVESVVMYNGLLLEYASDELKDDKEVVLAAVKQNVNALKYASKKLRNDKEYMLNLIKQIDSRVFQYASERLKNDKETVIEVLRITPYAIKYASKELQNDEIFRLESIKVNEGNLLTIPEELKNNKEFILKAIKENGYALKYLPEKFKNNIEMLIEFVKINPNIITIIGSLRDRDSYLSTHNIFGPVNIITIDDQNMEYLKTYAKLYETKSLKYIPVEKRTKTICLEAVMCNGSNLLYVPPNILLEDTLNNEIIYAAINQNPFSIAFVPNELIDGFMAQAAVDKDLRTIKYIPKELRSFVNTDKYTINGNYDFGLLNSIVFNSNYIYRDIIFKSRKLKLDITNSVKNILMRTEKDNKVKTI